MASAAQRPLSFKTLLGFTLSVPFDDTAPGATGRDLKRVVSETLSAKHGMSIAPNKCRVILCGREITDETLLAPLRVRREATLHLIIQSTAANEGSCSLL